MQNAVAVSVRLGGIGRLRRAWLVGERNMQVRRYQPCEAGCPGEEGQDRGHSVRPSLLAI